MAIDNNEWSFYRRRAFIRLNISQAEFCRIRVSLMEKHNKLTYCLIIKEFYRLASLKYFLLSVFTLTSLLSFKLNLIKST